MVAGKAVHALNVAVAWNLLIKIGTTRPSCTITSLAHMLLTLEGGLICL